MANCKYHPERVARANLDGDHLCQACCDAWVRGEGSWVAWQERESALGNAVKAARGGDAPIGFKGYA